jgi:nuclear pore complex protein Nup155
MVVLEEEDDIVGVGFVKPKANIFMDNIQQLLIISTIREVKVTAVSYDRSTGLKFYRTDMTTNTAGVNMISIVGTNRGRVFMLGRDGNVWELDYRVKYY